MHILTLVLLILLGTLQFQIVFLGDKLLKPLNRIADALEKSTKPEAH